MLSDDVYAPFKLLTSKLRRSKRDTEIQMADILKDIIHLRGNSQNHNKEHLLQTLAACKARMKLLQKRLQEDEAEQTSILGACQKRIHIDTEEESPILLKKRQERIFNEQVVQMLCGRRKISEARKLIAALPEGAQFKLMVDLYESAYTINDAILKNDLRPLKDWCYDNSNSLAKINSRLEFKLIACSYLNILNNSPVPDKAIQFLRKSVSTLTLSEEDKEDLNKLTFILLGIEEEDQEYYYGEPEDEPLENFFDMIDDQASDKDEKKEKSPHKSAEFPSNGMPQNRALRDEEDQIRPLLEAGVHFAEGAMRIIQYLRQNQPPTIPHESQPLTELPRYLMELPALRDPRQEDQEYEDDYESISDEQQQNENADIPVSMLTESLKTIQMKTRQKKQQEKQEAIEKLVIKKKKKHYLQKNGLKGYLADTSKIFMEAFSSIYRIPFRTIFDVTLGIGISVIKTNACCRNLSYSFDDRSNCPVCAPQVQRFAKKIPMIQHNESSLICRINGSLMNQQNYPIALPNKQIYSVSGLQSNSKNGKYQCMVTGKWFRKSECRKVYLT